MIRLEKYLLKHIFLKHRKKMVEDNISFSKVKNNHLSKKLTSFL
jgi:hypothetical protein